MKTLKSINKLAYLVTTLFTSLIFAQEEASWLKGFKLSGNADIFYKADFAGSDNNTKTSFTALAPLLIASSAKVAALKLSPEKAKKISFSSIFLLSMVTLLACK